MGSFLPVAPRNESTRLRRGVFRPSQTVAVQGDGASQPFKASRGGREGRREGREDRGWDARNAIQLGLQPEEPKAGRGGGRVARVGVVGS